MDSKCSVCKAPINSYALDVVVDVPYIYHAYHYPEKETTTEGTDHV